MNGIFIRSLDLIEYTQKLLVNVFIRGTLSVQDRVLNQELKPKLLLFREVPGGGEVDFSVGQMYFSKLASRQNKL